MRWFYTANSSFCPPLPQVTFHEKERPVVNGQKGISTQGKEISPEISEIVMSQTIAYFDIILN